MPLWIRMLAVLLAVALLAWLGVGLVRGVINILNNADFSGGERDPMFAEEAEKITRPPELDMEETPPDRPTLDDYVPEVESPVDMTVEELIEEAQRGNSDIG